MSHNLIPSVALLAVWPAITASAVEPVVPNVVLAIHGGIAAKRKESNAELEKNPASRIATGFGNRLP